MACSKQKRHWKGWCLPTKTGGHLCWLEQASSELRDMLLPGLAIICPLGSIWPWAFPWLSTWCENFTNTIYNSFSMEVLWFCEILWSISYRSHLIACSYFIVGMFLCMSTGLKWAAVFRPWHWWICWRCDSKVVCSMDGNRINDALCEGPLWEGNYWPRALVLRSTGLFKYAFLVFCSTRIMALWTLIRY